MEILLIRHPQVEKKREDVDDDRRFLTKEGGSKFEELLPKLKEKLPLTEGKKIVLWTSPAIRTIETAHIVAWNFQIGMTTVHDFIYEGNFEEFKQELQTVNEETTLVIVGHQPYLSKWVYDMTGIEPRIKKGNIINLKVINKEPLEAELQWMMYAE